MGQLSGSLDQDFVRAKLDKKKIQCNFLKYSQLFVLLSEYTMLVMTTLFENQTLIAKHISEMTTHVLYT